MPIYNPTLFVCNYKGVMCKGDATDDVDSVMGSESNQGKYMQQ